MSRFSEFSPFIFLEAICVRKESEFQKNLIRAIKQMFPGCIVMKNDPLYNQGIPDLLILYKHHWAMLECKRTIDASRRPNQEYFIDKMNTWSYASFVYPENVKEVLHDLEQAFAD